MQEDQSSSDFYLNPETKEKAEDKPIIVEKSKELELFTGRKIPLNGASIVTNKYATKVIVIVGEKDCGKTTLLSTIFDLFQTGTIKDFLFAGSLTQIGFEQASHFSRSESGSSTPDTERTKSSEFEFLHLSIKKLNALEDRAKSYLFSDVSGEKFRDARKSSTSMQELNLLRECDQVLIMLDGERISNPRMKHSHLQNMFTFLRMAIENNILNAQSNVKIILTKLDKFKRAFDFKTEIEKPFIDAYSSKLGALSFASIAARADSEEDYVMGHGIYELMLEWDTLTPSLTEYTPSLETPLNYFDKYNFKEAHE